MFDLTTADPPPASGFSWPALLVLIVVVAVAWPVYRQLRAFLSRRRHERWAREGLDDVGYTRDNDPDLRHGDD